MDTKKLVSIMLVALVSVIILAPLSAKALTLNEIQAEIQSLTAQINQLKGSGQGLGPGGQQNGPGLGQNPGVFGKVTATNGTTLTVNGKTGPSATDTAYTIDASKAVVTKKGATATVADIAIDDIVVIQGTVTGANVAATTIHDSGPQVPGGSGQGQNPFITGTVSTINGTTLMVNEKAKPDGTAGTSYTVDAANATVIKNGASAKVTDIAVNDTVMISGTISGMNVTAEMIRDGQPQNPGGDQGDRPGLGPEGGKSRPLDPKAPKESIAIDGNGHAVIRGKFVSAADKILTIQSWGITFTVDTSKAKLLGPINTLAKMQAGDLIGVQAKTVTSASATITADVIRDWNKPTTTDTATGQ